GRRLLLLAVVLSQLGALSCQTLRGSVTCLDCPAGHHLSGTFLRTCVQQKNKMRARVTCIV
uniref:Uncharacterized protein n=1 Tax=Aegilops tauschii subsp. strangulata TaxID=200361 RepID=A0A453CQ00_AEGTS